MIKLCTDPTCDENEAITIQRQADVSPVGYCLTHGYQREAELKQRLENYALVVTGGLPPSELDLARDRIQELEEQLTDPGGSTVDGEHGLRQPGAVEQGEQLKTALDTLEIQSRALSSARSELADREQALQSVRRELDRTRGDLERTRTQLAAALAAAKTEPAPAPVPPATITPPPPTRPDANKP